MLYIDRDAFISILKTKQKEFDGCGRSFGKTAFCVLEETINKLQSFPTADVAPVVHAHWIKMGIYRDGVFYKCSACPRGIYTDDGNTTVKDFPYCHCGAKMDGKENDK